MTLKINYKKIIKKITFDLYQLLSRQSYPLLILIVFVLLVPIILLLKKNSQGPAFNKTGVFSSWEYQASLPSSNISVSAKSKSDQAVVDFQYQNSSIQFDYPIDNASIKQSKDNEITFTSKDKNTLAQYQILENSLKESIILYQLPSSNKFISNLKVTNADAYLNSDNLPVFLHPKSGEYLFHIQKPYAIDAAGNKTYALSYELLCSGQSCTYPVSKNKLPLLDKLIKLNQSQSYQLVIKLDSEWLNDPSRVLPIIVDPTIVHDTSSEFATGQLNRVKDTGSGSSPSLESYYQELSSDPNTIALWHMNEASGNILDSSGNNNTGTPTGTTVVSGLFGNARSFNGTSDYIDVPYTITLQPTESISYEAWINTSTPNSYAQIVQRRKSAWLSYSLMLTPDWLGSTSTATCTIGYTSGTDTYNAVGTKIVTDGQWHHLACTYDKSQLNLYVDGQLDASTPGTQSIYYDSSVGVRIGTHETNETAYFPGIIDEVRISNIALSAEEIRLHASRRPYSTFTSDVIDLGTSVPVVWNSLSWTGTGFATGDGETLASTTGLVAQWNFNNTSGTVATNNAGSCGASCNGTLTNFLTTSGQDVSPPTAIGGTITYSGSYTIHTFKGSGTFTPSGSMNVEVLVVAGGGGGANTGSGGGAGGYVYNPAFLVTSGAKTVTVGNGGAGGATTAAPGVKGSNSVFSTITAEGGGRGVSHGGTVGGNGGSGGGGSISTSGTPAAGGTGSQGYAGGAGYVDAGWVGNSGGGGGAGGVGAAGGNTAGTGNGGIGLNNSISGASVCYAGGGGAGEVNGSYVGSGQCGGGSGVIGAIGTNGTANTGGGGGGGSFTSGTYFNGGNGGSGIVIIRYKTQISGWTANNRRWGAGALRLDGVDDYVSVGNKSELKLSQFTASSWVKVNKSGSYSEIMGNLNFTTKTGYKIEIHNTGTPYAEVGNGSNVPWAGGKTSIVDGKWHFLTATFDGTNLLFYVDAILVGTTTSGAISYSTDPFTFGKEPDTSFGYSNIIIDSSSVYNRALTASEILSNYNSSNLEFQTRVGSSTNPNDGTWEVWRPTTSETQIASLDSDSTNWSWDNTATYMPKSKSNSTVIKQEGTSSLKIESGVGQTDANTVGLWHLDETGGTGAYLKDVSSSANHGTPTGTTVVDGITNKARSFNGSSDRITVSNTASLRPTNITIEAWVYANGTPSNYSSVIMKATDDTWDIGYGISYYSSDGLYFWVNKIGTAGAWPLTPISAVPINQWFHVAGTYDGTTANIYINGQLAGSDTCAACFTNSNNSLYIGSGTTDGGAPSYLWNGRIDEVKISNIARSAEQIAESYRSGRDHYLNRTISSTNLSTGTNLPFYIASDRLGTFSQLIIGESPFANYQPDANTVGFWHLDEIYGISDTAVKDSSGYGIDLNNFTDSMGTQGKIGMAEYFNGVDSHTRHSSYANYRSSDQVGTIDAWINVHDYSGKPTIFMSSDTVSSNKYFEFWIDDDGFLVIDAYNGVSRNGIKGSTLFNIGQWYHVAGLSDGSSYSLYVNGVKEAVTVAYGSNNGDWFADVPDRDNIEIGAFTDTSTGYYFNGIIDEVRVSNIARSADEIRQAYEIGARTHNITIDFKAKLVSTNLIANSSDYSFNINAVAYGAGTSGANLYLGDKIIIKENYNGIEYLAQGVINSVNPSTGAVTVTSWDTGSTFPASGFTINATVFKWQREYFNLTGSLSTHRDATTYLTYRITDGSLGANIWLDDLRSSTGYLNNSIGSTITSSLLNRYFQYRAIFTQNDLSAPSSGLTSATLDYLSNRAPNTPTLISPAVGTTMVSLTPSFKTVTTDLETDNLQYEVKLCIDSSMNTSCQTFTAANIGWSGANVGTSSFSSGTTATYVIQVGNSLATNTTYYWKTRAIDPAGSNTWSSTQTTANSFTTYGIKIPANCLLEKSPINDFMIIKWLDQSTEENGYTIQKKIDGGIYSDLINLSAGTTAYTDSSISSGHTYQYRIASFVTGPIYADWCETPTFNLQTGSIKYEGILFQ